MNDLMPQMDDLGSLPGAIFAVMMLLLASLGTGQKLREVLSLRTTHWSDLVLIEFCLGLNLLALAGVILGTTGISRNTNPILLMVPGIVYAFRRLLPVNMLPGKLHLLRQLWSCRSSGWWLLGTTGVVTLGQALCYPTGWDELVYHSLLPREWNHDGHLSIRLDLPYSAFPSLCEILCWMIAPAESLIAPRLLNWCFWFISVLGMVRLCRLKGIPGSTSAALVTAVACSKAFLLIGQNCYVETYVVLNLVALLILLTDAAAFRSELTCRSIIAVGILSGACVATKLTSATIPILPAVWWACSQHRVRSQTMPAQYGSVRAVQLAAVFVLIVCCFVAPFLVRPWLATGNPLHPYFSWWFDDAAAVIASSQFHHAIGTNAFGLHTLPAFVTGPWLLASEDDIYDGSFGWQLPIFVALAVWGIVDRYLTMPSEPGTQKKSVAITNSSRSHDIQEDHLTTRLWPLISVLLMYVFWFTTAQQSRFLVPATVVLLLSVSDGLKSIVPRYRKAVVGVIVAATIISLPYRATGYYAGSWETLAGRFSWSDYVSDGTGQSYLEAARFLGHSTPEDARVLLLFEHRSLYLPRKCSIGTPLFTPRQIPGLIGRADAAAFAQFLREEQFDYVLAANQPIGPDQAPEFRDQWEPAFVTLQVATEQGLIQPVWTSDEHSIWRCPPKQSSLAR